MSISIHVSPAGSDQNFGNDYASLGSDPGFVDAENGDFNLNPDSPALKAGFIPLPLTRMLGDD